MTGKLSPEGEVIAAYGAAMVALVMLATILVAFERTGLAAIVGGIGFWLVARSM